MYLKEHNEQTAALSLSLFTEPCSVIDSTVTCTSFISLEICQCSTSEVRSVNAEPEMVYICNWDCNGSSMLFTLFLPLYDYMHLTPLVLRVCQALRHNFVHMAKQSVKRLESRHELFIFESSGVCGVFSDKALPASRQQIQIPKR